jgi:hypothetical protein
MTVMIRLSAIELLLCGFRIGVPQPAQNLASAGLPNPQVAQFI